MLHTHEIVEHVLNILEHDYGIEGIEDLGPPTVAEISEKLEVIAEGGDNDHAQS